MSKFLTLPEVGVLLGRSPKAVWTLIQRRKLPFSRIGGRLFIEEEELARFLDLCRKWTAEDAARMARVTPASPEKEAA